MSSFGQPAPGLKVSPPSNAELLFDFEAPVMINVMETLFCATRSAATILILGESGTGKSVVARAVHQHSQLNGQPFVTVNCPSLSKELLESDWERWTPSVMASLVMLKFIDSQIERESR